VHESNGRIPVAESVREHVAGIPCEMSSLFLNEDEVQAAWLAAAGGAVICEVTVL